jgi:hypothetical protein
MIVFSHYLRIGPVDVMTGDFFVLSKIQVHDGTPLTAVVLGGLVLLAVMVRV